MTLQTKLGIFAKHVDLDETVYNKPFHLDLHCLQFWFDPWLHSLFATMDISKHKGSTAPDLGLFCLLASLFMGR